MKFFTLQKKIKDYINLRLKSNTDTPLVMVDSACKFFDYTYVSGWYFRNGDRLKSIEVTDGLNNIVKVQFETSLDYPSVNSLDRNCGWKVSILSKIEIDPEPIILNFITESNHKHAITIGELISVRQDRYENIYSNFISKIKKKKNLKILDLGGRDRSKIDRSETYGDNDVTVLDIIDSENVDIVGDAHNLSSYFEPDYFDAIVSSSVFEHLHSPWKVVLEMNKILKKNGLIFISTHQSVGIHDQPWDYFRFSEYSWKSLFNKSTGFKILDVSMTYPNYIISHLFRPELLNAEKSAGFELSQVFASKESNSNLSWDVETNSIIDDEYPDVEDSFDPEKMKSIND
tara:strand:+ start:1344 stop:2375 length:1032 start_codon:yes stop_codon:yes gene_type:complete